MGGPYDIQQAKTSENHGEFYSDINSSFENLSQEKIRNAINIQPKIMELIIVIKSGHTTYMRSGSDSKGD